MFLRYTDKLTVIHRCSHDSGMILFLHGWFHSKTAGNKDNRRIKVIISPLKKKKPQALFSLDPLATCLTQLVVATTPKIRSKSRLRS